MHTQAGTPQGAVGRPVGHAQVSISKQHADSVSVVSLDTAHLDTRHARRTHRSLVVVCLLLSLVAIGVLGVLGVLGVAVPGVVGWYSYLRSLNQYVAALD